MASLSISALTDFSPLTTTFEPPHSRQQDRATNGSSPPSGDTSSGRGASKEVPAKGSAGGIRQQSKEAATTREAHGEESESESEDELLDKLNSGGGGLGAGTGSKITGPAGEGLTPGSSPGLGSRSPGVPKKVINLRMHAALHDQFTTPQRPKRWKPTPTGEANREPEEGKMAAEADEADEEDDDEEVDKEVDKVTHQASQVFQRSHSKGRLPPLPSHGKRRRRRSTAKKGGQEMVRHKLNEMAPTRKHQLLIEQMGHANTPDSQGPGPKRPGGGGGEPALALPKATVP